MAARIVSRRRCYYLSGARFAARHICESAAASTHDSAPFADDDCAAVVVTGEPVSAAFIRSSPAYCSGSDPPVPGVERLQTTRTMADTSKGHLDPFCGHDFGLARSPLYELTLRSPTWHIVEHACFLSSGVLFWWPVIQPWPSRPHWPEWAMIPYLLLADVQNTVLSAFLTFSDRVVYPTYGLVPQFPGMNPLSDQHAAGAIMWVPGSIVYLIPAAIIAMRFLSPRRAGRDELSLVRSGLNPSRRRNVDKRDLVLTGAPGFDILALGWFGRVIRSLAFRRVLQSLLFGLALLIIYDGLFGPQIGPMNLAGTLPWTHWRGLSVLALVAIGNFFCFACPFTFARDLGRRILPG